MSTLPRGRRGVVFTLIALILVAYLLASERAAPGRLTEATSQASIARARLGLMDAYVASFEEHAGASLQTSVYLALSNISESIRRNGTYVVALNSTIERCALRNSIAIAGTSRSCMPADAMINASLDRLVAIGSQELGITTTYFLHNVTVAESAPFEVDARLEISYNVSDPYGSFQVVRRNLTVSVDVTGIEDPVYSWMSNRSHVNAVRAFRETRLLRFQLNSSTFADIYDNRTYVPYEGQAPSVLDRYQGRLDKLSGCCGIESVVRRTEISSPSSAYMNYSFADHQLARHLAGTLAPFGCANNSARAKTPPTGGGTLVLDTYRFDNLYNLTGTQLPQCSWS